MQEFWQALTTHPMTPWFGWLALGTLAIFAALGQIRTQLESRDIAILPNAIQALMKKLGAEAIPPWLFFLLLLFWSTITLLLFFGLLSIIWEVIMTMLPASPETHVGKAAQWEYRLLLTKLAALTTVLGATVALPFTIIRLRLTNEQTRHAEDVLFNTKLNEAVESLHARYQVTEKTDENQYVDIWKDDIIKRNGAIDRLESLAVERPEEAPRIARTFCVYLRELTREYPAERAPENMGRNDLRRWVRGLSVQRSDMETAAQALGRMPEKTGVPPKDLGIDLTGVNLQAMNLNQLNFEQAKLEHCHLDGAQLNAAKLNEAKLNEADLIWADLNGAELNRANLYRATLNEAKLNGAKLNGADATAAPLRSVNLSWVKHVGDFVKSAFGDASVILPDDVPFPSDRWPDTVLDSDAYREEYQLFYKDPDAYIPPQHRNS